MGVCQSALDSVNEAIQENPEMQEEYADQHRVRENKKTGEIEDFEPGDN